MHVNDFDDQCRAAMTTLEMFPDAYRVEIKTNVIDDDGDKCGEFIVSATRTDADAELIVGIKAEKFDLFQWNKEASDNAMFGKATE